MIQKLTKLLALFTVVSLMFSCTDDQVTTPEKEPIVADFEITIISGDSSPVIVSVENKTTGATSYEWSFPGADGESSNKENPDDIYYLQVTGDFTITLKASNGSETETVSKTFSINVPLVADFESNPDSFLSSSNVTIVNKSRGATSYKWSFPGGAPESSTEKEPEAIYYATPGTYDITLEVSNGVETDSRTLSFVISEEINIDFDLILNSEVVPAELQIVNKTTGANQYKWTFSGGKGESTLENPGFLLYEEAGEFEVTLEASNSVQTKELTKSFTLNTNEILSFQNIVLGAIEAQSTLGSVFSTELGTVIKSDDINDSNGEKIDIVFVGESGLLFFESPQKASGWGLKEIPNATNTSFINYIEGSSVSFSVEDFDNMTNSDPLNGINITNDEESFPSSGLPRIILFQNSKGKKGVIKITNIASGRSGSITFDLKVQK